MTNTRELEQKIVERLKKAKNNFNFFAVNYLNVKSKGGRSVPFFLNDIQLKLLHEIETCGKKQFIILKARQMGVTTFIQAYLLARMLFYKTKNQAIIAHTDDASSKIFDITKYFYRNSPEHFRLTWPVEADNSTLLKFVKGSVIRKYTASGSNIGRGSTNNYLHCSEVAFWDNYYDIVEGITETVSDDPDNLIFYESTANGNNHFRELFEEGLDPKSKKRSLFFGWHEYPEYSTPPENNQDFVLTDEEINLAQTFKLTKAQLNWRRNKIAERFSARPYRFKQEYPIMWQEAFLNEEKPLIEPEYVYNAARNDFPRTNGAIVVGIDPARTGDRTVICVRQDRKILKIYKLMNKEAPFIEGFIMTRVIPEWNPNRIFIDASYGRDIACHVQENGFKVIKSIYFNSSPIERDIFTNIRSEMHEKAREWFMQPGGVDIINDRELINEICIIPDMEVNSLGKFFMVEKDIIKKLNRGKSPDYMDALALTFAEPVKAQRSGESAERKVIYQ